MQKWLDFPAVYAKMDVSKGRAVCPLCKRPTSQRIMPETAVSAFPLYCKFCRTATIVYRVPEPESTDQSQSL